MFKIFNAVFTLLIISISCSENIDSASYLATDYMPLEIGNKWYYGRYNYGEPMDSSTIWLTKEVVETKEIRGKTYYAIKRSYSRNTDTLYYRTSDDSMFILRGIITNPDLLEAVFSKAKGEQFTKSEAEDSSYSCYVQIIEKDKETITFSYNIPNIADDEYWSTYKRGIGMIDELPSWGTGSRLIRAELK